LQYLATIEWTPYLQRNRREGENEKKRAASKTGVEKK